MEPVPCKFGQMVEAAGMIKIEKLYKKIIKIRINSENYL